MKSDLKGSDKSKIIKYVYKISKIKSVIQTILNNTIMFLLMLWCIKPYLNKFYKI